MDNTASPSSDSDARRPLKKGPWTNEEDQILVNYLAKHGVGNWDSVHKYSGLSRCAKSCRLRWTNQLRPGLRKVPFTPEEESKIIQLHARMGNKWSRIATELPGRTDNEIKNFWNTRKKKLNRAAASATQENQNFASNHSESSSQINNFRVPVVNNIRAPPRGHINYSTPHPSLEHLIPRPPLKRPREPEIILPTFPPLDQPHNDFYNGHRSGDPSSLAPPSTQYSGFQGGIRADLSPLPSLESVDTLIHSPSNKQAQSINCPLPWNNGSLGTIIHESKALKNKTLPRISDSSTSSLNQSAGSSSMVPQSAETPKQGFGGNEGEGSNRLFCLRGFVECDCGYCGNTSNEVAEPSQSDNLSDIFRSLRQ